MKFHEPSTTIVRLLTNPDVTPDLGPAANNQGKDNTCTRIPAAERLLGTSKTPALLCKKHVTHLGIGHFAPFLLQARTLLGAPGLATRSKDATRGSWHRY